ncbi:MAG: hypothetical protein K2X35_07950 [Bryobacteraceae bacterium]|nr:hypothetical protein [Bryobacteraceae bacterium]
MKRREQQRGYALLMVLLVAAGIALMLYAQMPRVAFERQRDKEELLIERGEQYRRAVQVFFVKFRRFPQDLKELEDFQNYRSLRRRYKDPMTGKDDWKLLNINGAGMLTNSKVTPLKDPLQGGGLSAGSGAGSNAGDGSGPQVNQAAMLRPSDRSLPGAGSFGQTGGNPNFVPGGQAAPGDPSFQPQPQGFQPQFPGQPGQIPPGQPGYVPPIPGQPGQPGQPQFPVNPNPPFQPGQPPFNQPGQPPFNQPGQPPFNQPGQPPFNQPGGQPFPQPGGQPFNQPGQPPFNQPGQPPFNQPGQPFQPGQQPGFQPGGQQPFPQPGVQPFNQPGFQNPNANPIFRPQIGVGGSGPATPGQNQAVNAIGNLLTTPRQPVQGGSFNRPNEMGQGGIAGVASKYEGTGIKVYREKSKYDEWEFVFDLRGAQQGNNPTAPNNPLGPTTPPTGPGPGPRNPRQ